MTFDLDRRKLLIGGAAVGAAPLSAGVRVISTDFGTKGDDSETDVVALQRAYDAVAKSGGGTLFIPRGRYRCALLMTARTVRIEGEGRGVTILSASETRQPIIRLQSPSGDWTSVVISDVSLAGDANKLSVGIEMGHPSYHKDDEYIGRLSVVRVDFEYLSKCICRRFGNLGLQVDDCSFGHAEYHLWSKSFVADASEMHAGCVSVRQSVFTGFQKAMAYFESGDTISGQVVFEQNVFETGPGFVFYIKGFRSVGGVPSITVRDCWNEDTATGRDISIGDHTGTAARFLFADRSASPILFDDTPIGTVELRESLVTTQGCALDNLSEAIVDAESVLTHHQARQTIGTAPGLCRSIAGPTASSGLHTPWFRMPLPLALTKSQAANLCFGSTGNAAFEFTGRRTLLTQTITGDAALPFADRCQEITLAAGEHWQSPAFTTGGRLWYVTLYIFRLVSGGPIRISGSGNRGFTGETSLFGSHWQCQANISSDPGPEMEGQCIMHTVDMPTTLRISGLAVVSFSNRQEALSYVNDRLFPA